MATMAARQSITKIRGQDSLMDWKSQHKAGAVIAPGKLAWCGHSWLPIGRKAYRDKAQGQNKPHNGCQTAASQLPFHGTCMNKFDQRRHLSPTPRRRGN